MPIRASDRGSSLAITRAIKLIRTANLLSQPLVRRALVRGVFPSTEHLRTLRQIEFNSVIDVGANRGQFALVARVVNPRAQIASFEPLSRPAEVFDVIFAREPGVELHRVGLADHVGVSKMRVTKADDSSSILPASRLQVETFPGAKQVSEEEIRVARLDDVDLSHHQPPRLMKLDVQGYEENVLSGASSTLKEVRYLLAELSFEELYRGQTLASGMVAGLHERGFDMADVTNITRLTNGRPLQADFLFRQDPGSRPVVRCK